MTHPRRLRLIWLALAAMLAVAFLPTVSHALAHARGGATSWAEICTPQGLRSVEVALASADRDAAPAQAAVLLEHCPLCSLVSDHPGLPPASQQIGVRLPFHTVRVPLFVPPPRARPAWRHAQPRGPPIAA